MPTTYTLISSTVVTGSTYSITFSSIPQTYTDLVIKTSVRFPVNASSMELYFNSDQTSFYSTTAARGAAAAASSFRNSDSVNLTGYTYAGMVPSTYTADTFSSGEWYIPSYTGALSRQSYMMTCTENNSTVTNLVSSANLWRKSDAITSINIVQNFGYFLVSGSSFYLYGIKKN
jgi:hypothetical protein